MATELTAIFAQLEVPAEVRDLPGKGKHIVSTRPIPGNTVLFEEIPIISWSFASREGRYCDWCLASLSGSAGVQCPANKNTAASAACPAIFCSEECATAAKAQHGFLCGQPLKTIRDFDQALHKKRCCGGAAAGNEDDADDDGAAEVEELPVTLEALARGVASIAQRYTKLAEANPDAAPSALFPLAAKMFNRLVSVPDTAEWDELDTALWFKTLRAALCPRLLQAVGGNKEVVEALTSDSTLGTMLGQLSLNSQALNLPVVVQRSRSDDEEDAEDEDDEIGDDDVDSAAAAAKDRVKNVAQKQQQQTQIIRPSVGAGVFALHSCLNHSCDPNCFVVFGSNHEISVKTRRSVKQGEELSITYIPELFLKLENFERRRERLKNYFFTCACPVCLREEALSKDAAADASNPKEDQQKRTNNNDDDAE